MKQWNSDVKDLFMKELDALNSVVFSMQVKDWKIIA